MVSLTSKQKDLFRARLIRDLARRSVTGTFIYIFVWIVLSCNMVYKDSHETLLTWLLACTLILVSCSLYRAVTIHLAGSEKYSTTVQHSLLISGALVSSLAWGLISAFAYFDTPLNAHSNVLLLSTVALSAGGTITLFVSKPALNALLSGLLLPTLFVQLMFLEQPDYEICSILLIFYFGLTNGSKNVCKEYNNSLAQNIVLEDLSSRDQLTGLKNRRYFDEQLTREFDLALLHEHHRPLSVVIIDIDHFKQVNDQFGHLIGDESLKTVAETLKRTIDHERHTVARYGGEEFIILLPKTGHIDCIDLAEILRATIEQTPIKTHEDPLTLSASLGCYTLKNYGGAVSPLDMLHYADQALYQSKENGRNQVSSYSGFEDTR